MERTGVPDDTSVVVQRRQLAGLRAMTPAERLERTQALCRAADELAYAGMRARGEDLSPAMMRRRLAVIRYGPELVRRAEAYRANRDEQG